MSSLSVEHDHGSQIICKNMIVRTEEKPLPLTTQDSSAKHTGPLVGFNDEESTAASIDLSNAELGEFILTVWN